MDYTEIEDVITDRKGGARAFSRVLKYVEKLECPGRILSPGDPHPVSSPAVEPVIHNLVSLPEELRVNNRVPGVVFGQTFFVDRNLGLNPVPQSARCCRLTGFEVALDSQLLAEIVVQIDATPNVMLDPDADIGPCFEEVGHLELIGVDEPDSTCQIHPFPRAELQVGLKTQLPKGWIGFDEAR